MTDKLNSARCCWELLSLKVILLSCLFGYYFKRSLHVSSIAFFYIYFLMRLLLDICFKIFFLFLWNLIFRIGGESLAVAQNTYAVSWFKGAELNMVFGLQLSFSRVVSITKFPHQIVPHIDQMNAVWLIVIYILVDWFLLISNYLCSCVRVIFFIISDVFPDFLFLKGSTVNMNVMGPMYKFLSPYFPSKKGYLTLGWTLMVGKYSGHFQCFFSVSKCKV